MSEEVSPYDYRDHESVNMDSDDIRAVAGLLGQVTGSLKEIDSRNVGGQSQWIQANKTDPKQLLRNMVQSTQPKNQPVQVAAPPTQQTSVPVPPPVMVQEPVIPPPAIQQNSGEFEQLKKRVLDLEKTVEAYKNVVKFKRGVSYTISTSKISGSFKDPGVILDLISTEMAKQTKVITLKLNDESKSK